MREIEDCELKNLFCSIFWCRSGNGFQIQDKKKEFNESRHFKAVFGQVDNDFRWRNIGLLGKFGFLLVRQGSKLK